MVIAAMKLKDALLLGRKAMTNLDSILFIYLFILKIWNASRICVSSMGRGHANLCIVPILVYVLPKRALIMHFKQCF